MKQSNRISIVPGMHPATAKYIQSRKKRSGLTSSLIVKAILVGIGVLSAFGVLSEIGYILFVYPKG